MRTTGTKKQLLPADVEKWIAGGMMIREVCLRKIEAGEYGEGSTLASLALGHRSMGLSAMLKEEYGLARGHFDAAGEVLRRAGEGVLSMGFDPEHVHGAHTTSVLLALVGGVESSIVRCVATARRIESSGKMKIDGLGHAWLALAEGDRGTALNAIAAFGPQKYPWTEALRQAALALAHCDHGGLQECMTALYMSWRRRVGSEALWKQPDAVCDVTSTVVMRLATRLCGVTDLRSKAVPDGFMTTGEFVAVDPEFAWAA